MELRGNDLTKNRNYSAINLQIKKENLIGRLTICDFWNQSVSQSLCEGQVRTIVEDIILPSYWV